MTAVPRLVIDLTSGVAQWRQVRDQLALLIAGGQLAVGAQLPTIRQLAGDLGLATGTVARAYRELESHGVLHTARRRGTVIIAKPGDLAADPFRALTEEYVSKVRALGISIDSAVVAVREAFDRAESEANPTRR